MGGIRTQELGKADKNRGENLQAKTDNNKGRNLQVWRKVEGKKILEEPVHLDLNEKKRERVRVRRLKIIKGKKVMSNQDEKMVCFENELCCFNNDLEEEQIYGSLYNVNFQALSEEEDGDELEELAPKQYRTDGDNNVSFSKRRRTKPKSIKLVSWKRPRSGTMKLNVDGGSNGNLGAARGGRLIRDISDRLIASFAHFYGVAINTLAESCTLRDGLAMCKEQGWVDFVVESDSMLMVKWAQDGRCTLWEENMAADYLAKNGATGNSFTIQKGDYVPLGLRVMCCGAVVVQVVDGSCYAVVGCGDGGRSGVLVRWLWWFWWVCMLRWMVFGSSSMRRWCLTVNLCSVEVFLLGLLVFGVVVAFVVVVLAVVVMVLWRNQSRRIPFASKGIGASIGSVWKYPALDWKA
ncbi:unnamed protein product [Fraxinus pennsylvanica]|uniref:RNase H type-1 domain-containing protein n=1 Tax=Fraxinus pennsylvanica TaxID=56036 RepID=A0AAD2DYL1_9LAMI|nr:unnamed protein product [Fraxinus pennsylvanica]